MPSFILMKYLSRDLELEFQLGKIYKSVMHVFNVQRTQGQNRLINRAVSTATKHFLGISKQTLRGLEISLKIHKMFCGKQGIYYLKMLAVTQNFASRNVMKDARIIEQL